MNTQTFDIRPLTPEQPLNPAKEVALTPKQAAMLEPMNRQQRREWLREQQRQMRKDARRALRQVQAEIDASRVYATDKPDA